MVAAFALLALLAGAAYGLNRLTELDTGAPSSAAPTTPHATSAAPVAPLAAVSTADAPPAPKPRPPVLALAGEPPTDGPGTFRFATGEGEVLGDSGPLRRFRIGMEENIDLDLDEFVEFVEQTLAAPQGWTAGGDVRFQRVPDGAGHDFTIYLATSGTTDRMCAAGGLRVMTTDPPGGVSCRLGGQVILNLHRWWQSVPHFVEREVPLSVYRQMVLNHEVGHELGYGHEGCPRQGGPAPVMQQQTLSLRGCEPNPWPYLDGVRHTGPWVP